MLWMILTHERCLFISFPPDFDYRANYPFLKSSIILIRSIFCIVRIPLASLKETLQYLLHQYLRFPNKTSAMHTG